MCFHKYEENVTCNYESKAKYICHNTELHPSLLLT